MKRLVFAVALMCATANADEWLPMMDGPRSGDKVVLNDRTYIMFTEDDFLLLTNKMAVLISLARRQWNSQHATESGRVEWHGSRINTFVTTNANGRIEKVTQYNDGYQHVEPLVEKKIFRAGGIRQSAHQKPDYSKLPPRLRASKEGVNVDREVK